MPQLWHPCAKPTLTDRRAKATARCNRVSWDAFQVWVKQSAGTVIRVKFRLGSTFQ